MTEQRSLTFGEKAVGLTFNPSGDADVHHRKVLFAELIDFCHNKRAAAPAGQARHFAVAITQLEDAQMRAVKAITWRD